MFWILLVLAGLIFIFLCIKFDWDEFFFLLSLAIFVSGIIMSCIVFASGINYYPRLAGEYRGIMILKSRVKDIRNAYYDSNKSKNTLIEGNLENFKQSSNLSSFLVKVTTAEKRYSQELAEAHIYKKYFIFKFFGPGLFIHDEVLELPRIE
jgi:hypothetical protein